MVAMAVYGRFLYYAACYTVAILLLTADNAASFQPFHDRRNAITLFDAKLFGITYPACALSGSHSNRKCRQLINEPGDILFNCDSLESAIIDDFNITNRFINILMLLIGDVRTHTLQNSIGFDTGRIECDILDHDSGSGNDRSSHSKEKTAGGIGRNSDIKRIQRC